MDHQAIEPGRGSFLAFRRRHALPPGTPCYNCSVPLLGPWCYACGQAGEDFHRSAWHLATETFESFFHADGRFWRTLLRLARNPARLTRDYLAGKRAPQIPPLRLFLSVLLVLFLVGGWAVGPLKLFDGASQADRAKLMQKPIHVELGLSPETNQRATAWLRAHVGAAVQHPDALVAAMSSQAQDFAFMMLPISAFILAAIFAFRPGFVLFDHFVFSMHSLSFQGVLISAVVVLHDTRLEQSLPAEWLLLVAPVHLFAHMRGTYGTGAIGTLARMSVLFIATSLAFGILLLALLLAGLQTLRA